MSAIDTPFKRHSRAQGVTLNDPIRSKPSTSLELKPPSSTLSREGALRRSRLLNVRQTPSWIQSKGETVVLSEVSASGKSSEKAERSTTPPLRVETIAIPRSNWVNFVKLGTLVQGGRELLICCSRHDQQLFMLKNVTSDKNSHIEKTGMLQHRHIALSSFSIETESISYIAFQFTRHTLEELLHIHVTMDEHHIRAMALPVFQAIKYLHEKKLLHGSVNAQSIRICSRSGTVVLGDCDGCEEVAKPTGTDLEGLGIAILNCMEGTLSDLTATRVKECRASNKVFGLSSPEKWSEHKQLVDFVDDIFSAQRKPVVKFMKPVGDLRSSEPSEIIKY